MSGLLKISDMTNHPMVSLIERALQKKMSYICNSLMSHFPAESPEHRSSETDIPLGMEAIDWSVMWDNVFVASKNPYHKFIIWKFLKWKLLIFMIRASCITATSLMFITNQTAWKSVEYLAINYFLKLCNTSSTDAHETIWLPLFLTTKC